MKRIWLVPRMLLVNKWPYLFNPAIVLGSSFLLSLLIFKIILDALPEPPTEPISGWGLQAPIWYFAVVGVQSLTLTFPFSQAMSIPRKVYFAGTLLMALGFSLGFGLIAVLGGVIERATGGWWMNSQFFALPWVADGHWWETLLLCGGMILFVFTVGFSVATVFKRWGTTMVVAIAATFALLLVGLIALVTRQGWWGAVGDWFTAQTPASFGGLLTILALALATLAWGAFRRAVP